MIKNKKQMLALRILLGILVVCNMAVIFFLSSQDSTQSSALSKKITSVVAQILPKDYISKSVGGNTGDEDKNAVSNSKPDSGGSSATSSNQKPNANTSVGISSNQNKQDGEGLTKEQQTFVKKSHTSIRKLAHMMEFGALATLVFLFLATWQGKLLWRYVASLGFTFIYACTDEFHQRFIQGRGAHFSDVLIDFCGAVIACTIALMIIIIVRRLQKPKTERLSIREELSICFAWVSQMFSRVCTFVSKQVEKLQKTHKKKQVAEHKKKNNAENNEEHKKEKIIK